MLKVIMIGNLGGDAETREAGDSQVASFNVASTRKFKGRDGIQEETEWLKVEMWNPGGVLPYLLKGQQVYVEGSLRTERWKDRDGAERERKKVVASSVQLLGQRDREENGAERVPAARPGRATARTAPSPAPPETGGVDDLPF